LLDGANAFGLNPETGGLNRVGFSDADMAARRWIADTMRNDGLTVHTDAVGSVFGRWGPADTSCVMTGSHLDTVPEGGAFDGALGVCVALECVRAMRDAGLTSALPVEVAAFAEEEGRFGGMLGSQAVAGVVTPGWVEAAVDAEGIRLADAMRAQGFDPDTVATAARPPASVAAYLELHIEQGPLLETAGRSVGIARSVSGVCNLAVRLEGRANHSGTTPMDLRADAFAGLAEIAAAIPELIRAHGGPQSRLTIGQVTLQPNFPHTIPGRATSR
jgi:N-carbamoyl-L-amino-acid hydrolase